MRKIVLFLTLLVSFSHFSCTPQESDGGVTYDDQDGYWHGPGLYWGVYIDNEDDYHRHHDEHYDNDERRGGGHSGGGGHGGHGGR